MKGLDIDRFIQGVRIAVIDDLIKDLETLKLEMKIIKRRDLIDKIINNKEVE